MNEEIINRKVLGKEFERLIEAMRECYEWLERFELEYQQGWDVLWSFEQLKAKTQRLMYLFSDIFEMQVVKTDYPEDSISKLKKDLSNLINYLTSDDLARALNDPQLKKGEIVNAVTQIRTFLSYVSVVLEQTVLELEDKIPLIFVKHCLKNAGLVPALKELKKIEEKGGI